MRWPWHEAVRIKTALLTDEQNESIRSSVIESPFLANTTLNMRFATTWGFSAAFRREGLAKVCQAFPAFVQYLDLVVEERCNAFFLNPLVIFQGGSVEAHIDCSLRSYTRPLEPPCPDKVSVYYVQVPQGLEGGELVVNDARGKELHRIKPTTNMLIEFDGELLHHVTPFQGTYHSELDGKNKLGCSRISLVCEHYSLPPSLIIRIPEFHLKSSRNFGDFFDKALETEGVGNEA